MKPVFFRIVFLFFFFLSFSSFAAPVVYRVDPSQTEISFISQAPFETVIGKTKEASGEMNFDLSNVLATKALITVNTASLKTGNRLRDKDMRNKFLETKSYPTIQFRLTQIISGPQKLVVGEEASYEARGFFSIHGVEKEERVPATLSLLTDGQTLHVLAKSRLSLVDYHIERPKFLWMRLNEEVEIKADMIFRR